MVLELTPAHAIEKLGHELGLSDGDIAAGLDVSLRSLERWRAGETYPQRETRRRLAALLDLDLRLRRTFNTTVAISIWLRTPSRYLGGVVPLDAIRAGRFDRVEADLEGLDSGVYL